MPSVARLSMQLLRLLVVLLVAKIFLGIAANYRVYLPPNFNADFLLGRESYFWDGYHRAFFVHIFAGPASLILGTLLVSERFRRRFPGWHRRVGRLQGIIVLLLVAPTGLAMARHAASGPVAGLGFALLAVATAASLLLGWRAALLRRFDVHRRWMMRCYLMLFSTVIVRLNGGLGAVLEIDDERFYIQTAWTSWLVPLAAYELVRLVRRSMLPRLSPRRAAARDSGFTASAALQRPESVPPGVSIRPIPQA